MGTSPCAPIPNDETACACGCDAYGTQCSSPDCIGHHSSPFDVRLRGTCVHGNTEFDLPCMSRIDIPLPHSSYLLLVGGYRRGVHVPKNVRHIVNMEALVAYPTHEKIESYMAIKMEDGERIDYEQISAAARWVNVCLRKGDTLVHCHMGLNRSAFVAASALVLQGLKPQAAIDALRTWRGSPVLCNKTFERAIINHEEWLR